MCIRDRGNGVWGGDQSGSDSIFGMGGGDARSARNPSGRWPANLVVDEEAARVLDEVVGERPSSHNQKPTVSANSLFGGGINNGDGYRDTGGPSRFFYTAKSSRSERELGLIGHIPCRTCDGLDTETHLNEKGQEVRCVRNGHPTVKPLALMRWLCRLVTPPGGVVLDPFAGSGSTLIAAGQEGVNYLGCEKEEEYVRIAEARLAHWLKQPELTEAAT